MKWWNVFALRSSSGLVERVNGVVVAAHGRYSGSSFAHLRLPASASLSETVANVEQRVSDTCDMALPCAWCDSKNKGHTAAGLHGIRTRFPHP